MTGGSDPAGWRRLTPAEEAVIVHGATEPAFQGEYDRLFQPGTYECRRCGAPLYRSDRKFEAHCGWPAFDQEIPGAVRRLPDRDGERVEIRCARCDGHLGHVFEGEGFTRTNTRHCVNSISMRFVPAAEGSGASAAPSSPRDGVPRAAGRRSP